MAKQPRSVTPRSVTPRDGVIRHGSRPEAAIISLIEAMRADRSDEPLDLRAGFRLGRGSGDSPNLLITGTEYRVFVEAVDAVVADATFRHVSRQTVEDALWDLARGVVETPADFASPIMGLTRARRTLANIAHTVLDFESLTPTEGLVVTGAPLKVRVVTFSVMTDAELDRWLARAGSKYIARDLRRVHGRTAATVFISAGDEQEAARLARRQVDQALGFLRLAAQGSPDVNTLNVQLLFQRAAQPFTARRQEPDRWSSSFERGWRPVELRMEGTLRGEVSELVERLSDLDISQARAEMKERVYRAIHWISSSATRMNDRLVDLCTAAEVFLTSKADPRKGELIAFRSMLLAEATGRGFVDPVTLLDLYEKRSQIVHGSALDVCGEREYRWMQAAVVRSLHQFIELVVRDAPKSFSAFEATIAADGRRARVLEWLGKHQDARARKMASDLRLIGSTGATQPGLGG